MAHASVKISFVVVVVRAVAEVVVVDVKLAVSDTVTVLTHRRSATRKHQVPQSSSLGGRSDRGSQVRGAILDSASRGERVRPDSWEHRGNQTTHTGRCGSIE